MVMFDNDMLNLKTYLTLNDNLSNLNAFNKNICKNIKKTREKKDCDSFDIWKYFYWIQIMSSHYLHYKPKPIANDNSKVSQTSFPLQ